MPAIWKAGVSSTLVSFLRTKAGSNLYILRSGGRGSSGHTSNTRKEEHPFGGADSMELGGSTRRLAADQQSNTWRSCWSNWADKGIPRWPGHRRRRAKALKHGKCHCRHGWNKYFCGNSTISVRIFKQPQSDSNAQFREIIKFFVFNLQFDEILCNPSILSEYCGCSGVRIQAEFSRDDSQNTSFLCVVVKHAQLEPNASLRTAVFK